MYDRDHFWIPKIPAACGLFQDCGVAGTACCFHWEEKNNARKYIQDEEIISW